MEKLHVLNKINTLRNEVASGDFHGFKGARRMLGMVM